MSVESPDGRWQRQHLRYTVSDNKLIHCNLLPEGSALHVVSVSMGGCGVYQRDSKQHDNFQRLVKTQAEQGVDYTFIRKTLEIEYEGIMSEALKLQANLISSREITVENITVYYLGFQFIQADQKKISPLIQELDRLQKEGQIKLH